MQRLRQHNLGMRLRLSEGEFLVAQGPAFPVGATFRRLRMRVETGGYAERTCHEIAPAFSLFSHSHVRLGPADLSALVEAFRVAHGGSEGPGIDEDPDGVYRTVEFWDDGKPVRLRVEYVDGIATPAAPAFEAAWELLERQFPTQGHST